ncbi:MAG: SdpI family protein [Spirochaetota bacterium]
MSIRKTLKLLFIPTALSVIGTLAVYGFLPETVPTNWNSAELVQEQRPRIVLLLTAVIPALFIYVLSALPSTDPESPDYTKYEEAYKIASMLLVAFLIIIHWSIISAALGVFFHISLLVRPVLGLLFILVGRLLSKRAHNPGTLSLRTPWTLEHPQVREKTQQFGGRGFVLCGLVAILSVLLPAKAAFMMIILAVAALVFSIYLYSYLQDKKLAGSTGE